MKKIVEQGLLYDFYGELLTEHQREIYEAAVYNDMSLTEIADENGISKQGVHDLIKRCTNTLQGYLSASSRMSRPSTSSGCQPVRQYHPTTITAGSSKRHCVSRHLTSCRRIVTSLLSSPTVTDSPTLLGSMRNRALSSKPRAPQERQAAILRYARWR